MMGHYCTKQCGTHTSSSWVNRPAAGQRPNLPVTKCPSRTHTSMSGLPLPMVCAEPAATCGHSDATRRGDQAAVWLPVFGINMCTLGAHPQHQSAAASTSCSTSVSRCRGLLPCTAPPSYPPSYTTGPLPRASVALPPHMCSRMKHPSYIVIQLMHYTNASNTPAAPTSCSTTTGSVAGSPSTAPAGQLSNLTLHPTHQLSYSP